MGVDPPCVERVIFWGSLNYGKFFQESCRAGRDERLAKSTLYSNNSYIGSDIEGIQPIIKRLMQKP